MKVLFLVSIIEERQNTIFRILLRQHNKDELVRFDFEYRRSEFPAFWPIVPGGPGPGCSRT